MKSCPLFILAGLLLSGSTLRADPAADMHAMTEALQARQQIAAAVRSGDLRPAAAIDQLKSRSSSTGLRIDNAADFALAAIDIGHRLVAGDRAVEAELFFREAETALAGVIERMPDSDARLKAMYLRRLAAIRSDYLRKPTEAKADIERACSLQPEDKYLRRVRDNLLARQGDLLRNRPRN